ncbi:uracil-DNA glycosylase [Neoasaia chiangmaiensis NBRC 101099]|uniref:Uracil-DNA glycosylase n=1 Tax=Neoasaia chiangmaiensis TaxID=320497 RepID=A0A1U9KMW7_9PROT|nr:uracil-DNA glycosylase family protein [Neoasaia chiangmaiensis]AQS87129.1 uracil-DNA glycosylase [Neoasaia chiangmaiensis]GBR38131.1 uracil-DNA glycosylase [Neoasaia chiangmaiensis NBRC 101099]GEN16032.1 uracil-DNA glycosylase [Neoasaia chiangmaiensis]
MNNQPDPSTTERLDALVREVRACRVCAEHLPLGPRPLIHVSTRARILIASQAPGTKAHLSGKSFYDPSGNRLREWLNLTSEQFYDTSKVAILPMGLCYPGRLPNGGDRPPRPECAPIWRDRVLALMPSLRLTLLVGSYSQAHVLGRGSVSDRVAHFHDYLPRYFPLPHPSWRTGVWEKRAPWFQAEVIPALRTIVHDILSDDDQV